MEPNFHAFQVIAEVALGIIGFSAILIGLSHTHDGFRPPDQFRIQLLIYSSVGAMLCSLLPFAIFAKDNASEGSWFFACGIMFVYSLAGLVNFPRRMLLLRANGFTHLFPFKLFIYQTGILLLISTISLLLVLGNTEFLTQFSPSLRGKLYVLCLLLFLGQSFMAFIRTMFYRVD